MVQRRRMSPAMMNREEAKRKGGTWLTPMRMKRKVDPQTK
jgi:hypothetical protein